MNCSSCRFWECSIEKIELRFDALGACRRYPLQAVGLIPVMQRTIQNPNGEQGVQPVFALPQTKGDFWCGEYSPMVVS